jgi:hypothetical protein
VKWEVVQKREREGEGEREREGRPTSREGRGGKTGGKECVGREKADNGGFQDLGILRS